MRNKAVILESGQICTAGGMYKVVGPVTTLRPVTAGHIMPGYCGHPVRWVLLYKC